MKNKRKKLGAAGLTFLALLGGVIGVTAVSTTLVSCNGNKDYSGKQKAVINSKASYITDITITEQKTLDSGDMQITFSIAPSSTVYGPFNYFLSDAIIQANGASLTNDTDFKITKTENIITIYSSTLKKYKGVESFIITPMTGLKCILLDDDTYKDVTLKVGEETSFKVALSDGSTNKIEVTTDPEDPTQYITLTDIKEDGTITIKASKKISILSVYFSCEGYRTGICTLCINE